MEIKRHSLAHILAQAIHRIYGIVPLGTGPATDTGFYYDVDYKITDNDLEKIQDMMENIIKEKQKFKKIKLEKEKAYEILKLLNQKYKIEILESLNEVYFYINTVKQKPNLTKEYEEKYDYINKIINENEYIIFIDMCNGPHIGSTEEIEIGSFKLYKVAGAYRKGDENNKMLSRIYGYAFNTKEELEKYINDLEEAKKRDHKILGPKLGLFKIIDDVGLGLILRKPKGAKLYDILMEYMKKKCEERGYQAVRTPHIGRKNLWELSGHWSFYNNSMYPPIQIGQSLEDWQDGRKPKENEIYLLKPMNCPFHIMIYKDDIHSYKELPLKYYEFGTVYRYEKKGELGGLTRVRGFTQDDAHIICTPEQVENEISELIDFVLEVLNDFNFKEVKIYVSIRDKSNKYIGDESMRELAENVIINTLNKKNILYTTEEGEAAFYGPKIDFKIKDSLGRLWQCSTIQFDFNLPKRFDLYYIDKDGNKKTPFMIHRAIFGSFERFIGILIEHYGGKFPFWLAPVQIKILNIADNINYSLVIKEKLKNYRTVIDLSNKSLSKKIKEAEEEKIPFIVIIGNNEINTNTLSLRINGTNKNVTLNEFLEIIQNEENIRKNGKK